MIFNAPDVTTVFHDCFSMVSHQLHQVFAGALWYSHNNLLVGRHVGCCTNLSQGHEFNRRLRWLARTFEGEVGAFCCTADCEPSLGQSGCGKVSVTSFTLRPENEQRVHDD
jgi:hypothetical protein